MGCEAPICVNVRSAHVGTDRETVVLLHGSAGSSALWRHTKSALRPSNRCIAPDLIGYGTSAAWPSHASPGIAAEFRAIEPLLQCCASTFRRWGTSSGADVALPLALAAPAAVKPHSLLVAMF